MPSSADAAPGEEFEVMVYVQLENRGISSGEIILTFNGGTMEVVNVEPGALLGANPLAGLKKIDNQAGTAKYALAKTGSASIPTPPGIFAIFKLKILESAKSGAYELKLSKVSLADENFKDITGIKAQGTTVKVS